MKPRISVIVPVCNVERYLGRCLASIANQTFADLEIILINDGSTDSSGLICERYAKRDNRFRVIHSEYQGVSAARNKGIRAARGEYIGFVDGDDYIRKDMLEVLHSLADRTKSDISICKLGREVNGKIINEDHVEAYTREMDNKEAIRELFKGELYRFSLCNKLFRSSCFSGVEFPEGRIHEDLSTTYRLFANSEKSVFTNYAGYIYVKRENSILTSEYNKKRLDAFTAWQEILSFIKRKYPSLVNETFAAFGYWSVDNLYYILNQIENPVEKKRYLAVIQYHIDDHYRDILKNKLLSLKYKYIITLLHFSIPAVLMMHRINSLFQRKQLIKRKQVTEV